jgi:NTE family protein
MKRPFVLSGGGVRGFAHLGVLKAFEEKGVFPEAISATSAGAIVGAMVADGYSVDDILELSIKNKLFGFEWTFPFSSLLSLEPLRDFLTKYLLHRKIEEFPIPLFITATNLLDGSQKVFDKGNAIPAILAACAIPFVFLSVTIDNVPYVDGGVTNNLPLEPLLTNRYSNIIGSHANPLPSYDSKMPITENLDRMMHMVIRQNVVHNIEQLAMFIEPPSLSKYSLFDEKNKQNIYIEAYEYTTQYLAKHHAQLA